MSAADDLRRHLRDRTENHLRLAALSDLQTRHPETTTPPLPPEGGMVWRRLFVPAYRRLPWGLKRQAMTTMRMTAAGWTPPSSASSSSPAA